MPLTAEAPGSTPFLREAGSSAPVRVSLLADDLTGACDAAVAFAARGLATEVLLEPDMAPSPQSAVVARYTGTRDIDPALLADALAGAIGGQLSDWLFFKKIDSVFRGNTLAEIAHTVHSLPRHLHVLAPAFPATGRTVEAGELSVRDVSGERKLDLLDALARERVPAVSVAAGGAEAILRAARNASAGHVLCCDATEQEHLLDIVQALQHWPVPVAWIGSGGLAHALACAMVPSPVLRASACEPQARGTVAFFVGSDHPVTQAQVSALASHARAGGEAATVRLISVDRDGDADKVRAAAAHLRVEHVGALLMTGGDTAALVCRALGITSLELSREFAPGLPQGRARGGRFNGATVLFKSGGFGHSRVLCDIADTFAPLATQATKGTSL